MYTRPCIARGCGIGRTRTDDRPGATPSFVPRACIQKEALCVGIREEGARKRSGPRVDRRPNNGWCGSGREVCL